MIYMSPSLVKELELNEETGRVEPKKDSPEHVWDEWYRLKNVIEEAEKMGIKL